MLLHELIRDYRKSKGVSQMHLSKVTGIENDVISAVENGNRNLRANEFLLLCKGLEVDPKIFMDKLLENENQKIDS